MIETLARKRTNAVGLAVLAAMVAALFVTLQSVSAAACAATPDITLDLGASCEVNAEGATNAGSSDATIAAVEATPDATTDDDLFTITASTTATGTATITLYSDLGADTTIGGTGDNADTVVAEFNVTVVGFGIAKLEVVDDPDATVSAGPQITVRATLRSGADAARVLLTVPSTGLSIHNPGSDPASPLDDSTSQSMTVEASNAAPATGTRAAAEFTVNTAGAPAGNYTLTFTADNDGNFATKDGATEATKQASDTLTVTVGEPGTGLSSATLSLGNKVDDTPYTADDETVPESGTAGAGESIKVVIEAFDSLGGKASGAAINQITIFAHGGTIGSTFDDDTTTADTSIADGTNSINLSEARDGAGALTTSDIGQKTTVTISKTNKKPGTVTVRAFVAGPGGGAQTGELTLIFAGPAASMTVADASESLLSANAEGEDEDTIRLQVTAEDASGNSVDPPTSGVAITITDPDGKRVQSTAIDHSQPTKSKGKFYITLTGKGTSTSPLAAGNYTLKARSGKLEAEASFAVAGPAANIALDVSVDPDPVALGSVVSVTATVTDKDGNNVADGSTVDFNTGGGLTLDDVGTTEGVKTKNGVAKARFIVSKGTGLAVIIVDSGGASATASVALAAAAAADAEVSLDCLSSTTGFSSYTCSMGSTAAELFGMLSSRGATAIHLWNGSMWVRYAVVDGAEIPGSSDFNVQEDDILYISN